MNPRDALPDAFSRRPFTHGEAIRAGVTARRLRDPNLYRPFHGRRTADAPASLLALCRAFTAGMPSDAFFSSTTAIGLYGGPLPRRLESAVHVAVPRPRRALSARGMVGHSVTIAPGEVRELHGLSVSGPERAWCEAAALLDLDDLVAVGDDLTRRHLASVESIAAFAERYPARRGRGTLLAALPLIDPRAESRPETLVRLILARAGIVAVPQVVVDVAGRRIRIDLAIPALRVAIEYHGEYHLDDEQWGNDVDRRAALEEAGWIVVEIVAKHLRDPALIVARVRNAIARSASSGR